VPSNRRFICSIWVNWQMAFERMSCHYPIIVGLCDCLRFLLLFQNNNLLATGMLRVDWLFNLFSSFYWLKSNYTSSKLIYIPNLNILCWISKYHFNSFNIWRSPFIEIDRLKFAIDLYFLNVCWTFLLIFIGRHFWWIFINYSEKDNLMINGDGERGKQLSLN
jgi:hypothetical protein